MVGKNHSFCHQLSAFLTLPFQNIFLSLIFPFFFLLRSWFMFTKKGSPSTPFLVFHEFTLGVFFPTIPCMLMGES